MTKAQKDNQARFKKVQAEAKKLKAKNPKLKHVDAVKKAWAIILPGSAKKKAPVKKKTFVKKKAPIKKVGAVNKYKVYFNSKLLKSFNTLNEAKNYKTYLMVYASYSPSSIKIKNNNVVIGAVKKKAPIKKAPAKSYHKDTKSHNVKISVMSGISNTYMKQYHEAVKNLEQWNKILSDLELNKNHYSLTALDKKLVRMDIKRVKNTIKEYKQHAKELKKLI
jgi:hypothetical protein